jgi:hypothetical protein
MQALSVQLPLHQYEDELLSILEKQVPELYNTYIEQDMNQSLAGSFKVA